MTSKAALCKALLDGKVLNIKNGFQLLGITNIPREIGRSVERSFGVIVSRTNRDGTSRYGQPCIWTDYRLNRTEYNADGIKKMKEYIEREMSTIFITTDKQAELLISSGLIKQEVKPTHQLSLL